MRLKSTLRIGRMRLGRVEAAQKGMLFRRKALQREGKRKRDDRKTIVVAVVRNGIKIYLDNGNMGI